jgi:hypothetical protein
MTRKPGTYVTGFFLHGHEIFIAGKSPDNLEIEEDIVLQGIVFLRG